MKKKLSALLLTLAMCFSIMPSVAFAANVGSIPKEWTAPSHVTVINNTEGAGEFNLMVSYTVGADHSTFVDDIANQENYAKYGLTDAVYYDTNIQLDWRIDGGAWHYSQEWDSGNESREGADAYYYYRELGPYYDERASSTMILRLPTQENWSSDYEGWKTAMTAAGAGDLTVSDEGYMHLDLTRHKVDIRVRMLTSLRGVDVDTAYGEEYSYHYILSPWSAIASVGKGVATVEYPTALPVPTVTNFAVGAAKNDGTVDDGYPIFTYHLTVPADVAELAARATALWATLGIEGQVNVNNGGWQDIRIGSASWAAVTDGTYTGYMPNLTQGDYTTVLGGTCEFRTRYHWFNGEGSELYSDWSTPLSFGSDAWQSSPWATETLQKADELGLIPEVLKTADLTADITRLEFAAVAVKAYEALSGTDAIPAVTNPFTDCNDMEVLKAYNVGITAGTSASTFSPNTLLNREQAATMLTRVFKRVSMPGWTQGTDGDFPLVYPKPAVFADDADISAYAKDSVYFMAANGIISGVGNNLFAPKNVTTAQSAQGYANATREQALVIAVRMVENLK